MHLSKSVWEMVKIGKRKVSHNVYTHHTRTHTTQIGTKANKAIEHRKRTLSFVLALASNMMLINQDICENERGTKMCIR